MVTYSAALQAGSQAHQDHGQDELPAKGLASCYFWSWHEHTKRGAGIAYRHPRYQHCLQACTADERLEKSGCMTSWLYYNAMKRFVCGGHHTQSITVRWRPEDHVAAINLQQDAQDGAQKLSEDVGHGLADGNVPSHERGHCYSLQGH